MRTQKIKDYSSIMPSQGQEYLRSMTNLKSIGCGVEHIKERKRINIAGIINPIYKFYKRVMNFLAESQK